MKHTYTIHMDSITRLWRTLTLLISPTLRHASWAVKTWFSIFIDRRIWRPLNTTHTTNDTHTRSGRDFKKLPHHSLTHFASIVTGHRHWHSGTVQNARLSERQRGDARDDEIIPSRWRLWLLAFSVQFEYVCVVCSLCVEVERRGDTINYYVKIRTYYTFTQRQRTRPEYKTYLNTRGTRGGATWINYIIVV